RVAPSVSSLKRPILVSARSQQSSGFSANKGGWAEPPSFCNIPGTEKDMIGISTLHFSIRLLLAIAMGATVGLERQWRQRMAGTRTNALVAAGAAAFVMCGFMVRDNSRGEAQIVSYVVSGIGFLGAGVIFKDAGSVRGLNTAATIWCSAAVGAISGLGNPLHALILTAAVLCTNIVLRPLAYRLYPAQAAGEEQEVTYGFELVCNPDGEAHMRA